jgi:two-component system, LytTR family, response regulator LytT
MQILIIEDEELAVKKLQKTIANIDSSIEILGSCESIQTSVDWLEANPSPDLILMDIELADGQSFEIFNLINIKCPVIFTTSYDEFALKAFKVNSVDYLLKPIQKEELEAALNKFKNLTQNTSTEVSMTNLLRELQAKLQPKEYRKRFLVKYTNKLISVNIDDVAYFYSDGRFNFFKTYDGKKYAVDYTMDELAEMLDPDKFFRISRAFFVAIASVVKIEDYFGNRIALGLNPSTEKEAVVSREKVADFKKWMGK